MTAKVLQENSLPEDQLFEQLIKIMRDQKRSHEDIDLVARAFEYGREMHDGQLRKNGDNYITHPVSVAIILSDIPVDSPSLAAAILHDVVEDTDATDEDLTKHFGEEVAKLVEGVTKLGKLEFTSVEDRQAENFRRMFLAMADDVRVIILKLGDRLHNMRTLQHMKPEKQIKKATETLEIFAPLAHRLGMGKLKVELEDLSLRYLNSDAYVIIENEIKHTKDERSSTIDAVIDTLNKELKNTNVKATVYGRVKNYYSIYKKMTTRKKEIQDIFDISALRILVPSEKDCYQVLGLVHHHYPPIPGRFKDYIAMPKSNLYQSLHTTVIGPKGRPLEVQIRTEEMHRIAEYGIAAHWKYKESGGSDIGAFNTEDQKLTWLKQMLEMKDDAEDAHEYVDSVKLDLFRDEVFVFTPKGKVINLPAGSTPVDFAYRIHTEVGHACVGSIINGKIQPLNHVLHNGDIIEILTNKKSKPRLDWIKFVQTHQAKSRIRHWYKRNMADEHKDQGRHILEAEMTRAAFDEAVKSGRMSEIAQELHYNDIEELFMALGYGELSLPKVLNRLRRVEVVEKHVPAERIKHVTERRGKGKGDIEGLKGMLYNLAKCCSPVPGEPIVGIVTRSRGVMVHREDCPNILNANEDRMMVIDWSSDQESETARTHSVKLEIHVIDRLGVLKDILTKIADINTNISNTRVKMQQDQSAIIEITVQVKNIEHLERVKNAVRKVPDVVSVTRSKYRTSQ